LLTEDNFLLDSELKGSHVKTILIVDDDPSILEVLKIRLKRASYRTLTAASGEEALELLKTERPDLILLDMLLPKIQGEEVCRQIKSNPDTRKIFVILFSASIVEMQKALKDVNADDILAKPFEPEDLLAKIRRFVG
jgi:two-component system, OmpR family, alkaline phosphatase synthesis response regulator PhoP